MRVKFKQTEQRNVIFYGGDNEYPIIQYGNDGYVLVEEENGCRAWFHKKFMEPVIEEGAPKNFWTK